MVSRMFSSMLLFLILGVQRSAALLLENPSNCTIYKICQLKACHIQYMKDLDTSQCDVADFSSFNSKYYDNRITLMRFNNATEIRLLTRHILSWTDQFFDPEALADMPDLIYPIFYENFIGIDLQLIEHQERSLQNREYHLVSVPFHFYLSNTLISNTNCTFFQQIYRNRSNLFNQLGNLYLHRSKFSSKICTSIFTNIRLYSFVISTFIPEFIDSGRELNTSIDRLTIQYATKLVINNKTLNLNVYRNIRELAIAKSSVSEIDRNIFKDIRVKSIRLEIINLKPLIHMKGLEWIYSINSGVNVGQLSRANWTLVNSTAALIWIKLTSSYLKQNLSFDEFVESYRMSYDDYKQYDQQFFPYLSYNFPNEDICFFKSFPFNQLVFMVIKGGYKNCTCTMKWLLDPLRELLSMGFRNFSELETNLNLLHCTNESVFGNNCELNNLTRYCEINQVEYESNDPYFALYDLSLSVSRVKKILIDIIGPIVAFLGIITNTLTILTLAHNYKRKELIMNKLLNKDKEIVMLKEPLYQQMLLSSVLNAMSCLLYLLYYLIPCSPDPENFFYGRLYYSDLVSNKCVVVDLVVSTLGSVLKLMSNFSLIMFSVHRYILIGKNHIQLFKKISEISMKAFLLFTLVFSSLISLVTYFQKQFFAPYYIGNYLKSSTNYMYNYYYLAYDSITRYQVRWSLDQRIQQIPLLFSVTIIHDLFSYFLFCLLSAMLDLFTLRNLHDSIKQSKMLSQSDHRDQNRSSELRGMIMVGLSSLSNIIFRAPELISVIFYYYFSMNGPYVFKMLCFSFNKCLTFIELANTFYLMGLGLNFFFYLKFNTVFEKSYKKMIPFVYNSESNTESAKSKARMSC